METPLRKVFLFRHPVRRRGRQRKRPDKETLCFPVRVCWSHVRTFFFFSSKRLVRPSGLDFLCHFFPLFLPSLKVCDSGRGGPTFVPSLIACGQRVSESMSSVRPVPLYTPSHHLVPMDDKCRLTFSVLFRDLKPRIDPPDRRR